MIIPIPLAILLDAPRAGAPYPSDYNLNEQIPADARNQALRWRDSAQPVRKRSEGNPFRRGAIVNGVETANHHCPGMALQPQPERGQPRENHPSEKGACFTRATLAPLPGIVARLRRH